MSDQKTQTPATLPVVNIPGLTAIPVVAVRLPNGTIALRHPDELQKPQPAARPRGGK